MDGNALLPRGRFGCAMALVILVLAIGLTVESTNNQRPRDPTCYGHLGAGFPISFLCDDDAGSPISSWGKIDIADWYNIGFVFSLALYVDVLFFFMLLSLIWFVVRGLFYLRRRWQSAL